MKVILKGFQHVNYFDDKNHCPGFGIRLYFVSFDREDSGDFVGYRVFDILTNIELPELIIDSVYDLSFIRPIGCNSSYLTSMVSV